MAEDINLQTGRAIALLLGAGYTSRAIAGSLRDLGYEIWGTTREAENVDSLAKFGIQAIVSSSLEYPHIEALFEEADVIISAIPPAKGRDGKGFFDPVVSLFSDLSPKAKWIGYLSATSVYGDRQGQWAFEGEPASPQLKRGFARAEAELEWLETGWPVHIFRLAGIYGPDTYGKGRNPFDKLREGSSRAVIKEGHVVNRIHVDDITTAVIASIARPNPQAIYNLADGYPAPPQDVLDFAAGLINAPKPMRVSLDHESVSDMARTFYSETKRIDITCAQSELNWVPKYSDYEVGLEAILKTK